MGVRRSWRDLGKSLLRTVSHTCTEQLAEPSLSMSDASSYIRQNASIKVLLSWRRDIYTIAAVDRPCGLFLPPYIVEEGRAHDFA